jgi:hypothetical protein
MTYRWQLTRLGSLKPIRHFAAPSSNVRSTPVDSLRRADIQPPEIDLPIECAASRHWNSYGAAEINTGSTEDQSSSMLGRL